MTSEPIQILAVSDQVTRSLYPRIAPDMKQRLESVDLIVSCGDLPPEYLMHLQGRIGAPLFYIKGNHDIRYQERPPLGCHNLHARLTRFKGLRVAGFDGSRWYNGGPHQYTESQMRRLLRRMWWPLWRAGGLDLVITHAPPRFVHDAEDPCHRGFRTFNKLVERYQPSYFLHGHLHEQFSDPSERVDRIGRTRVVNCYDHHFLEVGTNGR